MHAHFLTFRPSDGMKVAQIKTVNLKSYLLILTCAFVPFLGIKSMASQLHPHAEKLKSLQNPQMTISRYVGHPDFQSQRTIVWGLENGKFKSGKTLRAQIQKYFRECESFLSQKQNFPLEKMVETKYLQPNQVSELLAMSTKLSTSQVNFLQISRDMNYGEAKNLFGDHLEDRIQHTLRDYDNLDILPIITAAMWTIAGQALDPKSGIINKAEMPWQKDPIRAELAKNFDRKKYKYLWEWGRTAQDLPNEAAPLFAAATAINYQELLAMGGELEDAYIMFHSLSKVNTRFYNQTFPDRIFPQDWQNKDDALFLVPLVDAIKAFPPSEHSSRLAKIIEYSGGALDEIKALQFWQKFQRIQLTQLDFVGRDKPMVFHNLSIGAAYQRLRLLHEFGILDNPKLSDFLMTQFPPAPSWNSGQYVDISDMNITGQHYINENAIEISNLDPKQVARDPREIEKTLLATLIHYLKTMAVGGYESEHINQALEHIVHMKIKFGITTFNKEIAARIEQLKPISQNEFYYPKPDFEVKTSDFPGQEWLAWGYISPPTAYLFTVGQILEFGKKHPDLYAEILNSVNENKWARHLILTNPDVF